MAYYVTVLRGENAAVAEPIFALSEPQAVQAVLQAVRTLVDEGEAATALAQERECKAIAAHERVAAL